MVPGATGAFGWRAEMTVVTTCCQEPVHFPCLTPFVNLRALRGFVLYPLTRCARVHRGPDSTGVSPLRHSMQMLRDLILLRLAG